MIDYTNIAFALVAASIILLVTWRLFFKKPQEKKNES